MLRVVAARCFRMERLGNLMRPIARPLSPHLQVYRWQISSVLSILHRTSGAALGISTLLFAWWLIAVASGPGAYATVHEFLSSSGGTVLLIAVTWALFYHLCNGVRHLAWDAGFGFELRAMVYTGCVVVAGSIALTIISFILAYSWA
jgi:succinate dehydrogenase / fumarate reductase, cytochrome b subunit